MTTFSIIGSGNMAQAIGGALLDGGNRVQIIGRDAEATVDARFDHAVLGADPTGDIVILALPYGAIDEVVTAYSERLAGRIVVDISNPLNFETFDSLVVAAGSSAAAELAERLPNSTVLKAFNTNFASTLATARVGENTTTVLIAGDDSAAKLALAEAVQGGGLNAVDAGSLKRAEQLEQVGFLQLTLAANEKIGWNAGFALIS